LTQARKHEEIHTARGLENQRALFSRKDQTTVKEEPNLSDYGPGAQEEYKGGPAHKHPP
jgi:hypothetical protein